MQLLANVTARQMKRSIQEQLKENHELGFLKLESNYYNHKGVRYINVKHIAGLTDTGGQSCDLQMEYHNRVINIEESGQEVAAQIRRVIKRLDQDQELCCQAEVHSRSRC